MENTLIIAFELGQAYLAPGCGFPMNRTNIPETYQPFRSGIYWTVTVLYRSSYDGNLITQIQDYRGSREKFLQQTAPVELPPKIIINGISCSGLYAAWDRTKSLPPVSVRPPRQNRDNSPRGSNPSYFSRQSEQSRTVLSQVRSTQRSLTIPWERLTYLPGAVSFEYTPGSDFSPITIRVDNPCLCPEMRLVTAYLAKASRCKEVRFEVELNVTYAAGTAKEVAITKASSSTIASLDSAMIENVNRKVLAEAVFKRRFDDDHELHLLVSARSPVARTCSPQQALNEVLAIRDSKHHRQLDYLASKHLNDLAGLRFTTDPVSFLFLLEGSTRNFFALEVYDQKLATYLWAVEKSREAVGRKLLELEPLMKHFRAGCRLDYRTSQPEGFSWIDHDYSDPGKGFDAWKSALDRELET